MSMFRSVLSRLLNAFPGGLLGDTSVVIRDSERLVACERATRGRLAAVWLQIEILVDVVAANLRAAIGDFRRPPFLGALALEARLSFRRLRRGDAGTLLSVLTCALAVGASVAVGSVVTAVFFDAGGVERATDVVGLEWSSPLVRSHAEFSYPDYETLKRSGVFEDVSGSAYTTVSCSCASDGGRVIAGLATDNFFSLFGVSPELGNVPVAGRDEVLLSFKAWREAFSASPLIVGQSLSIDSHAFRIVGVAPRRFASPIFGVEPAVWLSMSAQPIVLLPQPELRALLPDLRTTRGYSWVRVWARVRRASTARDLVDTLHAALPNFPDPGLELNVTTLYQARIPPELRPIASQFVGGLVLTIVFVLGLAAAALIQGSVLRAEKALPEMAARLSLGAPLSLAFLLPLVDTAILVLVGGVAGLCLAPLLLRAFILTLPHTAAPITLSVSAFTWRTGAVAAGVLLALSVVPSVVACVRCYRGRWALTDTLRGFHRASPVGLQRVGGLAVFAQLLTATALLGAALFVAFVLVAASHVDLGFVPDHLVVASLDLDNQHFTEAEGLAFLKRVRDELARAPGCLGVTLASRSPLDALGFGTVLQLDPRDGGAVQVDSMWVDDNYFDVMGVPVLSGRVRLGTDAERPHVLSARAAALRRRAGNVTVVANVHYRSVFTDPSPVEYFSLATRFQPRLFALARFSDVASQPLEAVRASLSGVSPLLHQSVIRAMETNVSVAEWVPRTLVRLLTFFTAIALVVSVAGTFSVVAFVGQCRRRELAIRQALGASCGQSTRAAVGQISLFAVAGCLCGTFAAYRLAAVIERLAGVGAEHATAASACAATVCALIALSASWIAAPRARQANIAGLLRAND
jgi:hypothetical protein